MKAIRVVMISCAFTFLTAPLFAQVNPQLLNKNQVSSVDCEKNLIFDPVFFSVRGQEFFQKWSNHCPLPDQKDALEKQQLREQWEEFLGIDVFYPYFKVKQVEKYVQDKTKVDFFKFKGKTDFDEPSHSVKYIFRKRF